MFRQLERGLSSAQSNAARSSRHSASVDQTLCFYHSLVSQKCCLTWDEINFPAADHFDFLTIQSSDLGVAPNSDGAVIRLNIPALTEERRKDLVKVLHKKVEEGRVEIRTLRRHTHEEMRSKEKSSGVTADEVKRLEAQLQKLTDRYILMADEIGTAKEKEILAV